MKRTLGSAVFQGPGWVDTYRSLFSVTVSERALLAQLHAARLPGEGGRARTVSICLDLQQRPENLADTCLWNKPVMNKAQIKPLFKLDQSALGASHRVCFAHRVGQSTSIPNLMISTGTS